MGDHVREPELGGEAQLVCDEMAKRARQNVEELVQRLEREGYRFHQNDDDETPLNPHCPPTARAPDFAVWLENQFTRVPMTLLSWVRIVGDVWLVGTHPEWKDSASGDPLVIELEGSLHPDYGPIQDHFVASHDEWVEWKAENPDAGPFVLPVSPDHLHKANTSGGSPYGFILPDGCADGLFVDEVAMPFVSYLNWVFGHGGFPRDIEGTEQWRVRRTLAKDLLPL